MKLYLLYAGNAWLNTNSLQLLTVCTSKEKACELAKSYSIDVEPMTKQEEIDLKRNNQTYGRDENYMICEIESDRLE